MMSKTRLSAWPLLVALCVGRVAVGIETQQSLDTAKWREDLATLREQLPKTHGSLFHTMTRQQFDAELDRLNAALPDMTASQIKAGILRLIAMVNDGHTRVRLETLGTRAVPVRLHFFADGLYVVSAQKPYADIVGGRIKRIGQMSADEAYVAVKPLLSVDGDNDGRRRVLAVDLLVIPEILEAVGVTQSNDGVNITVDKDGQEISAALQAEQAGTQKEVAWPMQPEGWVGAREHAANPVPLWLQHPDKHYWHAFLGGRSTLYIQYNAVQDESDEPIAAYFPRLFREADRRGIKRVIIDVRLNGGGNNELNRPIWHALLKSDRLNRKGSLWVVIGPKTFSAAMNFVDDMELNTNATFVGEPTGETPNMWGDPVSLKLPNSGIVVRVSTLWWQFEDPRDQRSFRAPDVPAGMTFFEYANNVDPALGAILTAR